MSGIFGALMLDGSEPAPANLDAMQAQLQRRGPDGSHRWSSGRVALGHTLLATTPEALVEVLPLTDEHSGCTITADVRLDNRDELIPKLGLEGEKQVIGDGELILRAYLRWGDDCPKHLLGDFAFAIWDPRSQRLFCARDHMGMRPFVYAHIPGRLFAFSSDEASVLTHPSVPQTINEPRVADFLEDMEGMDFTSTFFENIFRLAPAHILVIRDDQAALRRYWSLELPEELQLPSDEAYCEALMNVLSDAVRCRLRSPGPVGAMVSGGLDSNTVAAIAGKLHAAEGRAPLRTFSVVGPERADCEETKCIFEAVTNADFQPATIDYRYPGEYRDYLAAMLDQPANPFDAHMTLLRAVYALAHRHGVRIVLDGGGGDLVLAAGNRVAQLLAQGDFRLAYKEARLDIPWSEHAVWRAMLAAVWAAFVPRGLRRARQRLAPFRPPGLGRMPKVDRRFAEKVSLRRRRAAFRSRIGAYSPASRKYAMDQICHPHTAAARERYDRAAAAASIEPRDPFLDVRIIEFCLSLPASQLKADGWPKLILRRATEGLVPDAIRWRKGKTHLGLRFTNQILGGSDLDGTSRQAVATRMNGYIPVQFDPTLANPDAPQGKRADPQLDSGTFIKLFALHRWFAHYADQGRRKD